MWKLIKRVGLIINLKTLLITGLAIASTFICLFIYLTICIQRYVIIRRLLISLENSVRPRGDTYTHLSTVRASQKKALFTLMRSILPHALATSQILPGLHAPSPPATSIPKKEYRDIVQNLRYGMQNANITNTQKLSDV